MRGSPATLRRIGRLGRFHLRDSYLEVRESELSFIGAELLGPLPVQRLLEFPDQMLEPLVLLGEGRDLGLEGGTARASNIARASGGSWFGSRSSGPGSMGGFYRKSRPLELSPCPLSHSAAAGLRTRGP